MNRKLILILPGKGILEIYVRRYTHQYTQSALTEIVFPLFNHNV